MHSNPPASPAGQVPDAADSRSLKSESPAAGSNDRWRVPGVCLFLAAITWLVFGQTLGHEFVNYDDNLYIADNPAVLGGLSLKGIVWAFTHNVNVNWTPLTVISHMLDCQLYGTEAGWHHLTSVLLHMASVIVLFLVLNEMTAALWRSAFVAAVFAIHPLHVESVAWIAERRDVLSGLFFMLTLWAYARYAQNKKTLNPQPSTLNYTMVLLFFALGLMSKPMVVTLPFVLLLLDYWPLGRISEFGVPSFAVLWRTGRSSELKSVPQPRKGAWPRGAALRGFTPSTLNPQLSTLLLEKLPLLALSGAACVATLFAQQGAIASLPLSVRIGNALVSCVAYLKQMIYPVGLAVYYPHPGNGLALWKTIAALVLLLVISAGAVAARRKQPWFLFGWLWYLGMLVPVIGLIQSGLRAQADRYTYLPQIGLYVLLTWAAADLCAGWRHRRLVLGGCSTVVLVALIFFARAQTAYWRNSESLWTHTLACTSDNFIAHNNLGNALLKMGSVDEAIIHYQKAVQINPDNAEAHNNLGNILLQQGKVDEAIAHCQRALQINPDSPEAHNNLGNALLQQGKVDEAIAQYQEVLQIKPDSAKAHNNLGSALLQKGGLDEAIAHYQMALQIEPGFAEARNNLDNALLLKGRVHEAITRCQNALQINPDSPEVLNNLAWLLATCPDAHIRDGVQAVKYAERACELTHYGVTIPVGTLAAAYAEAGRFDDAIAAAQKACALASAAGEQDLFEKNRKLLALYRAHQPYHETAKKFVLAAP